MVSLVPDILLVVAEQAELDTVGALMCTSKASYGVISEYEISVVKAKLHRFQHFVSQPAPPGKGQTTDGVLAKDRILSIQQPPITAHGAVLTSATPERVALRPYSFAMIQELNLREARYQVLFAAGGPLEKAIRMASIFGEKRPNEAEIAELITRLQTSCRLADRLSDCVAGVMAKWAVPRATIAAGFPEEDLGFYTRPSTMTQRISVHGVDVSDQTSLPEGLRPPPTTPTTASDNSSRGRRARNITTAVRRTQIALLHDLPILDLVFLANLISLTGLAYQSLYRAEVASDPDFWDRATAFQETVLRQGASVTLWGMFGATASATAAGDSGTTSNPEARPPAGMRPLKRFVEGVVCGTLRELQAWELGWFHAPLSDLQQVDGHANIGSGDGAEASDRSQGGLLPGLQMTVWGVIRERFGRAGLDEDAGIGSWIDTIVRDVVRRSVGEHGRR